MLIAMAEREMRSAFIGGFAGQLLAGLIWAASAAVSTWGALRYGMALLFFASMVLFPLPQLVLRALGHPARLSHDNTLEHLAQV